MALSSVSVPGYLGQLPGFLPPKALHSEVVMRRILSQAGGDSERPCPEAAQVGGSVGFVWWRFFFYVFYFIFILTILYWFCHIST